MIGSMAPDFGYFVHRFGFAAKSHRLPGTLLCVLPLAVLLWLGVKLVRGILSAPLPRALRKEVSRFLGKPAPALPWMATSLLLGIWSHTFLDSFTHASGWMVARFAITSSDCGCSLCQTFGPPHSGGLAPNDPVLQKPSASKAPKGATMQ